jgi:hypothetical protein
MCRGIGERVRREPAEFAKPLKTSLPIPHCTLWFRKSRPKITRAVGNCVECVHCNGWQRAIHRRASFRGKQKELVPLDSIARKCYRISNSQTAIPKQKHEGFETNCIGFVWVVITRPNNTIHLLFDERRSGRFSDLQRLKSAGWICGDPAALVYEAEERSESQSRRAGRKDGPLS